MGKVLVIIIAVVIVIALLWSCGTVSVVKTNWWLVDQLEGYQPIGLLQYWWVDTLPPEIIAEKYRGRNCALVRYESWTGSGFTIPDREEKKTWASLCPSAEDITRFGPPVTVGVTGVFWFRKTGTLEQGVRGPYIITGLRLIGGRGGWEQGPAILPKDFDPDTEPKEGIALNPVVLANCRARLWMGENQSFKFSRCDEFGTEGANWERVAPKSGVGEDNNFVLLIGINGARLDPLRKVPVLANSRPANLGPLPLMPDGGQ